MKNDEKPLWKDILIRIDVFNNSAIFTTIYWEFLIRFVEDQSLC